MTISCTRILRKGEGPEYRYPLSASPRPERRPVSGLLRGEARGLRAKAPQLVAKEVQRHRRRHGKRLRRYLRQTGRLHEQREQQKAYAERHEADRDEADSLEAGVTAGRIERPVAVQHEVVHDRDHKSRNRGHVVVDPEAVHAERIDADIDREPSPPDDPEADELEPVGRAA